MGGDWPDHSDATGIVGGEFVEGAVRVEQVALGADLAGDADWGGLGVIGGVALGEPPAPVLFIGVNDRSGVGGEHTSRRDHVFLHPLQGGWIIDGFEVELCIEFVE